MEEKLLLPSLSIPRSTQPSLGQARGSRLYHLGICGPHSTAAESNLSPWPSAAKTSFANYFVDSGNGLWVQWQEEEGGATYKEIWGKAVSLAALPPAAGWKGGKPGVIALGFKRGWPWASFSTCFSREWQPLCSQHRGSSMRACRARQPGADPGSCDTINTLSLYCSTDIQKRGREREMQTVWE